MRLALFVIGMAILYILIQPTPIDITPDNPALKPYVDEIVSELSDEDKKYIVALPQDGLVALHFNLAAEIRNRWIWNDDAPDLTAYMRRHGITHPDNMSGILIVAIWKKLYEDLPEEAKEEVDLARDYQLRDKELIKITTECENEFSWNMLELKNCFPGKYHEPLMTNHLPFDKMTISNEGQVENITYYFSDFSKTEQACSDAIIRNFKFSPFKHTKTVIIEAKCLAEGLGPIGIQKVLNGKVFFD